MSGILALNESTELRILVAGDQPDVLLALRLLLKAEGFAIETGDHPAAILRSAASAPPNLVLMDLNYTRDTSSGAEGLTVLEQLSRMGLTAPVIGMTAWGSVDLAVEAMRRGACDFVLKPWDNDRLLATLRKHAGAHVQQFVKATHDLDLARQVQAQLLPQRRPPLRTLDYDGHCLQAGAVGGDCYDFLDLAPGLVGLVLADISGKGIAAALLMSNLQAAQNLPLLLKTLNLQFRESTPPERYATLFFGGYDDSTRTLRYANCGHNPPLLLRASGDVEWLQPAAPVIGILPAFPVETAEVHLAAGDRLAIYSDGVTHAQGPQGGALSEDGLLHLFRSEELTPQLLAARIASYSAGEQFDDMTLVISRAGCAT